MIEDCELSLEKRYLKQVIDALKENKSQNETRLEKANQEFKDTVEYLSAEYSNIDEEEKASANQTLNEIGYRIDFIRQMISRNDRQKSSPYFAKINFETEGNAEDYYIGIFNLFNKNQYPLVCDWRAPISSIYYDYQCGKAQMSTPDGVVMGTLNQKRQFKIKDGKIIHCFDSSTTIQDEILIETLGGNTTSQMRNIVATIQNEQNKIIRADFNKSILVQGIAGSGKTSIALHRIAYLLYNNRDTLKSQDITILSPNKIFSQYISNVLPELGENNINQITFDEIAKNELEAYIGKLETRGEMLTNLLEFDEQRLSDINKKSSFAFAQSLKQYIESYFNLEFSANDIIMGEKRITKEEINNLYNNIYSSKKPSIRIEWITDYILDKFDISPNEKMIANRIKKILYPMISSIDMLDIYSEFCKLENVNFTKGDKIAYEDIAPLLYIKDYVLGIEKQSQVKFLVIDEMQDYSPIFFDLIKELFDCNKLILGDIYQTFEKDLDETYITKLASLLEMEVAFLNKSYRSTYEIASEEEKLIDRSIDKLTRHGREVEMTTSKTELEATALIDSYIHDWEKYNQIAIIVPNEKEAKKLEKIINIEDKYNIINEQNQTLKKYNIIPINYAKGLEFDASIIYNFNYKKNTNKKLLYIAISRALHELIIIN